MEYQIKENKINKIVFDFLETYFKNQIIDFVNPFEEYIDDDGIKHEGENSNVIEYFIGDYYEEDDLIFRLYLKDYWNGTNLISKKRQNESPIISILSDKLKESLDSMFNDKNIWEVGFRLWFDYKFDLKVNRIR